ncbi:MAG: site-specific integrase [Bdellovibrionales bacterium]|nr:site-specific integrase [Bdellovibrionales bacterium]
MRDSAEKNSRLKPFYLISFFQLRTGARIGEVCALHWEDINWELGTAQIHRSVLWSRRKERVTSISPLTKTNTAREVVLVAELLGELRKWKMISGKNKGLIFCLPDGGPISYRSVQYRYDVVLKAIGSDFRATHILRHSFATDALAKTMDFGTVQGMLGHKTQAQTAHYAKMTNVALKRGMACYEKELAIELGKARCDGD